jgi:hypothetical protein
MVCDMKELSLQKIAVVCFFLCLMTARGYSQLPNGNVFVGYSYLNADLSAGSGSRTNLNGWEASVENKIFPFVGLVADFSGQYGLPSSSSPPPTCVTPVGGLPGGCILTPSSSGSEYNFLFGPRVSFKIGKFRPFAHVLVGGAHVSEANLGFANASTSFANALGGGVDYHLIPLISWRVQADALQTRFFGSLQNNVRISTGIVIHF